MYDESLHYEISYNWGFIWVDAGEVTFSTFLDTSFASPYFHLLGEGRTYERYDWIYKVRDRYESWCDTTNLNTYKFYRDVNEGNDSYSNLYHFKNDSIYIRSEKKNQVSMDTIKMPDCTFDVLALVYYCRTIDYEKYEINEKIPLTLILDNEIQHTFIRFMGKEFIEVNDVTYSTIRVSPLLVEGSLFKGGEGMDVWFTDDNNRMPVKVEAEILVGSIVATLNNHKGLKYPIQSIIE